MRDSFIFYRSFYEAIKDLPRDVQGEIYTAIMEYSLYGKETEDLKPIARSIFTLIKPQIDVNNKRFENGRNGGRPPKSETKSEPNKNQPETKAKPKSNQSETKSEPNKNVNNNPNEDKETSPNGESKKVRLSLSQTEKIDYGALMTTFNKIFTGKLPQVTSMTEKRIKAVKARTAEHGKQSIMDAFNQVLNSPFLLGRNDKNWKCDFDWIFKPTNFIKILEGNYNGTSISKNQQDSEQRKRDSILAVSTTVREAAAKKRKELEAEGVI